MGNWELSYTRSCWPCRDREGRPGVPATHRLLVREVGEQVGEEVWGCALHIAQLYSDLLRLQKPLDVIVHTMEGCVIEAHPRQVG